jgi:hypothetical protein
MSVTVPDVTRYTGKRRMVIGNPVRAVFAWRLGYHYRLQPRPDLIGERETPKPWFAWADEAFVDRGLSPAAVHLAAVLIMDACRGEDGEGRRAARHAEEFAAEVLLPLPPIGWILTDRQVREFVAAEDLVRPFVPSPVAADVTPRKPSRRGRPVGNCSSAAALLGKDGAW